MKETDLIKLRVAQNQQETVNWQDGHTSDYDHPAIAHTNRSLLDTYDQTNADITSVITKLANCGRIFIQDSEPSAPHENLDLWIDITPGAPHISVWLESLIPPAWFTVV